MNECRKQQERGVIIKVNTRLKTGKGECEGKHKDERCPWRPIAASGCDGVASRINPSRGSRTMQVSAAGLDAL